MVFCSFYNVESLFKIRFLEFLSGGEGGLLSSDRISRFFFTLVFQFGLSICISFLYLLIVYSEKPDCFESFF